MALFPLNSIKKTLVLLVFVAVFPALSIMLYSGLEQRQQSIEHAEQDLLLLTHTLGEVQKDITRSTQQMLSTLALLSEVQAADAPSCRRIFKAVLKNNPTYKNIALADINGEILVSALPFAKTNIADRKNFQDAVQQKGFAVGEYSVAKIGKSVPALPFSYPVFNKTGELAGVLTTAINLERFASFYDKSSLPENSFVSVTDHNGLRLLFYPYKEKTNPLGKPIKSESWDHARSSIAVGTFLGEGSDGVRRIIAFEPLFLNSAPKPYLYVWAGIPERHILFPANKVLVRNLLLMLLAATVSFFITWLISRKNLLVPIQKLITVTEKIAAGDNTASASGISPLHELETLNRAFYQMTNSLAKTQAELKENEVRFRLVMDSLNAIVYVADLSTYEILFINQYGEKLFGDSVGKICWQVLQEGQEGPCPFCTNKYLLDETGVPAETCVWEFQNTKNGCWYHVRDRAISWVDGRMARIEIATDISTQKGMEEQLRHKFKMEAIGVMAGGIAHNFNNNLAIILGNLELSRHKLTGNQEVLPLLNDATAAVYKSRDLVRQIMTYSRTWSGEKRSFQLSGLIDRTLHLIGPTIPSTIRLKKILIETDAVVHADESQLQDVLINLCNNAVQAMQKQGELSIKQETVTLSSADIPRLQQCRPGRYAKLSVIDTGVGIPAEALGKIFDPFYTTKEINEGTGMGLSTVQGSMEQHGGFIQVQSAFGEGSTFELYLPLTEVRPDSRVPDQQVLSPGTERILFLDDEQQLVSAWSQALRKYGYQVTAETSSLRALERFRTNPDKFDLIICDQTMPDLTGLDFLKKVLKIRPELPAIICTGHSHKISAAETQALGIKACCQKPLGLKELLTQIRQALDTKSIHP